MRKISIMIALSCVFGIALTNAAPPPAPAELQLIMKAVQPIWSGLPAKVAANDEAGFAADAIRLEALFTDAQKFFRSEQMQQAADLARNAADAAGAAATAARAGRIDSSAKQGFVVNCNQCHEQYSTRAADGSYTLKKP
jgi:hypothetical protein